MKRSLPLQVALAALLSVSFAFAAPKPAAHAATAPTVATPATPASPATPAKKAELVDLNSAAKAELIRLPGIGDAIADKIIAGRPWKSKYDLVVKKVVTRAAYEKFSKYVIARQ
jgi:DNA uptake protein ComE-like DNA-binding protein